jgi:hypothetical protein
MLMKEVSVSAQGTAKTRLENLSLRHQRWSVLLLSDDRRSVR